MMWRGLTPSDRRTLMRGVIGVVSIVAVGKGVPALRAFERDRVTAADEAMRELAIVRAAATGQGAIADSLGARSKRLDSLRGVLIRAKTPQAAAALLATSLGAYATDCGARINATVLRPDSAFVAGVARVAVRLSLATDVHGLAQMLEMIESDERALSVSEMAVSSTDPGGPETRGVVLAVDLMVETRALQEFPKERAPPPARPRDAKPRSAHD